HHHPHTHHTHTHTRTHTHTHTHIHTHTVTYIHPHIQTHIHPHIHTPIHKHKSLIIIPVNSSHFIWLLLSRLLIFAPGPVGLRKLSRNSFKCLGPFACTSLQSSQKSSA